MALMFVHFQEPIQAPFSKSHVAPEFRHFSGLPLGGEEAVDSTAYYKTRLSSPAQLPDPSSTGGGTILKKPQQQISFLANFPKDEGCIIDSHHVSL
jgi:hypothetical protein